MTVLPRLYVFTLLLLFVSVGIFSLTRSDPIEPPFAEISTIHRYVQYPTPVGEKSCIVAVVYVGDTIVGTGLSCDWSAK